jgi:hypothetical protein
VNLPAIRTSSDRNDQPGETDMSTDRPAGATMRAAVVVGPGQIRLDRIALPEPGPGQVRVRL